MRLRFSKSRNLDTFAFLLNFSSANFETKLGIKQLSPNYYLIKVQNIQKLSLCIKF